MDSPKPKIGKKPNQKPERVDDIVRKFAHQDFVNRLYRDSGDQSWRNATRRGRANGVSS